MSTKPLRLLALLAAAASAAVFAAGPSAAAPAPATTTDPAAAAAGWLAQQFVGSDHKPSPSGDHFETSFGTTHSFDGGTTADAIFALAAAGAGRDKIDAAITYLAQHVTEYTSVNDTSGKPGPYDGQVAKAALAAFVAGADPATFGGHNLLQALKDDECTEQSGSTSDFSVPTCPAPGAGRNIFASVSESLVILVEARAGGSYAPSPAAVDYFLSLQCPNGGFTTRTSACTDGADASVDETGYAVAALLALGGHEHELQRAVTWLTQHRNPKGYWVAQGGPDVDSTGLAASALDAAGVDTASSRTWLAAQQVTTGPTVGADASRGALKYQGRFDAASSVKATADGLLGMVRGTSLATLSAKDATPGTAVLALAPATSKRARVAQGGAQTVTGTGFAAGERVAGVLRSAPVSIGSGTAGANGSVALTFTVPASLEPGRHTVTLTGARSGLATSASFTVTAAAPATSAPPAPTPTTPTPTTPILADTGAHGTQTETLIGLGLLVAGAAAAYAGRRRRP
jgi:LPXTG-motif cell wall-anchored protein